MTLLGRLEDWSLAKLPPEARATGRVAVRISIGLWPWGALFAAVFVGIGQVPLAVSLFAAAVGVGAAPVLLRLTRSAPLTGHWMIAWLAQSLFVSAAGMEGILSASLPWAVVCVVVAAAMIGHRAAIAWTAVLVAAHWALLSVQLADRLPPSPTPERVQWVVAALAHSGLLAVTAVVAIALRSITLRRQQELEASREAALAANRAKSEFLSRMSHELRTPLNAVLGFAELLAEDAEPADRADLERIRRAGLHLLSMVNDILDLARVETGRMEFRVEEVSLGPIVESVVDQVGPLVAARRNEVSVHISGRGLALADELRLRQCLFNLVGNAVKFTRDGQIVIVAEDRDDYVRIEIRDTGIGLTEEQLGRIFRPFVQGSADIQAAYGGTGLGLAIVAQIVEHLGGRISARSEPGAGSVFALELPRPP